MVVESKANFLPGISKMLVARFFTSFFHRIECEVFEDFVIKILISINKSALAIGFVLNQDDIVWLNALQKQQLSHEDSHDYAVIRTS